MILGCEFQDEQSAILKFSNDERMIELANITIREQPKNDPVLSLLEPIRIPAYSECFGECSVTTPVLRGTYLVEPNTPIFDTNRILVSRGILAVGKHSLLSLIANVTAN